jgi:hypothetical protein
MSSAIMRGRSFAVSLALIGVTMVAGVAIRFVPLGLPHVVVKYGGSMLWAVMIYWIVSALLPTRTPFAVAFLAAGVATAVEFLKLFHTPAFDAFRLTLPGILVLGRFFSVWDIVAYWVAIAVAAVIDFRIRDLPVEEPGHASL